METIVPPSCPQKGRLEIEQLEEKRNTFELINLNLLIHEQSNVCLMLQVLHGNVTIAKDDFGNWKERGIQLS